MSQGSSTCLSPSGDCCGNKQSNEPKMAELNFKYPQPPSEDSCCGDEQCETKVLNRQTGTSIQSNGRSVSNSNEIDDELLRRNVRESTLLKLKLKGPDATSDCCSESDCCGPKNIPEATSNCCDNSDCCSPPSNIPQNSSDCCGDSDCCAPKNIPQNNSDCNDSDCNDPDCCTKKDIPNHFSTCREGRPNCTEKSCLIPKQEVENDVINIPIKRCSQRNVLQKSPSKCKKNSFTMNQNQNDIIPNEHNNSDENSDLIFCRVSSGSSIKLIPSEKTTNANNSNNSNINNQNMNKNCNSNSNSNSTTLPQPLPLSTSSIPTLIPIITSPKNTKKNLLTNNQGSVIEVVVQDPLENVCSACDPNSNIPHEMQISRFRIANLCCAGEEKIIYSCLESFVGVSIENIAVNVIGRYAIIKHCSMQCCAPTEKIIEILNLKHLGASIQEVAGNGENEKEEYDWFRISHVSVVFLFFVLGLICQFVAGNVSVIMYLISVALGIIPILHASYVTLLRRTVDIHILMIIAIVGAIGGKEYFDASLVVSLFIGAELIEAIAMMKVRSAVNSTSTSIAKEAYLKNGSKIKVEDLKIGDVLAVRAGEMILGENYYFFFGVVSL